MKVIIVGGSATGMGVAAKLKRNDPNAEVIVYQDKDYVSLGACGLPYFVSNNFDNKEMLIARTKEQFEQSGIVVKTNSRVSSIDFDSKTVYFNDKQDTYEKLVIAIGAKPIIPNTSWKNLKNSFTITTLEDGIKLKEEMNKNPNIKKVAVIGAGFIGLEMTEALTEINKEVYLIEKEDRVSKKAFDKEFSELITTKLEEHNIIVKTSTELKEIVEVDGLAKQLIFSNSEKLEVDAIIFSIGFKPNTEIFTNTKLELFENGAIIVDNQGKTNIEDVYSAGDCATSKEFLTQKNIYSPLATVANKFAKVIADNLCGKNKVFVGSLRSAIFRCFDIGFARSGFTEEEAQDLFKIKIVFIKDKDHTHYLKGQKDIYLKLILDTETNTIIGSQLCAQNSAMLRANTLATIIWSKINVDEALEQIDLVYAPPYSKTTDILHIALSKFLK
ncbi:NADH oxidase [Spiroplasma helicoides]|uniref:NADH oxidase n=1 Tax=Spiroplasma helicoides TaxID=216938 RepID=A0A1B3SJY9_9MOLU|nr:CoA-disulfide reductase [Spiroplasma helicoides]AOG60237.1 NADH oxidase [Spiroplasma helicoides]